MESLHPVLKKAVIALHQLKKEPVRERDEAFEAIKEDFDAQD